MSELIRYAALSALLFTLTPVWGELRDPLQPYGFRQVQTGQLEAMDSMFDANSLRLSGIFIGPDGNSAMINGSRLRIGDQVSGAQLVTIKPQLIELDIDGDRIKIELLPITVKTPAKDLPGGGE